MNDGMKPIFFSPSHRLNRSMRYALTFIAGASMQLAFAPWQWQLGGLLALTVWATVLQNTSNFKQALLISYSFGLGWFAIGSWWLAQTVHDYGGLPWIVAAFCVLLTGSILALFIALWGGFAQLLARQHHDAWLLTFPAAAILSEWLRGHIFTGLPWTTLGNLTLDTPWSSWASIAGVYGNALFPALAAIMLASLIQLRALKFSALSLLFLIVAAFSAPDLHMPAGPSFQAGLIQASIPQDQKWNATFLQETMQRYARLSDQAVSNKKDPVDILVWPESAVPFFLEHAPGWHHWLNQQVQLWQKPLLFGGMKLRSSKNEQDDDPHIAENGLMLITPELQQSFAGKHHLVPFGEYVPSWIPWLHTLIPAIAQFEPSRDDGIVQWQNQSFGALICYESIFPEQARHRVQHGAQVLVIVTNDAWYNQTPAAWQHLQASQMRAIETGRYVLRAANTGVSAIIDPSGQITDTAPWWTQTVIRGPYQLSDNITAYVRWGDMPGLAVAFLLLMIGRWIRK